MMLRMNETFHLFPFMLHSSKLKRSCYIHLKHAIFFPAPCPA